MSVTRGYSLRLDGSRSLGDFLAGARSSSVRVFSRRYGTLLADEVAKRVDLHRAGVEARDPEASPLKESVEQIRAMFASGGRQATEAGLDLRLRIFPVDDLLLVRVDEGHEDYLAELAGLPGLRDASLPASGRPDGVSAADWAEREASWGEALSGPPLACGLAFRLVDDTLPFLRFAALRRHFPLHDVRIRRTARAALFLKRTGAALPRDAAQAKDFRRFLETAKGKSLLDQETRRIGRVLPENLDKDDAARYAPAAAPAPARTAPRAAAPPPQASGNPQPIDHADVIESGDGRIFVAVMDAGLANDERVHIQVVERHVAFVQNGVHYGGISDCPMAAVDLLRENREAVVVELRRGAGSREIKARHVALVRDDGRPDVYAVAMANFRNAAERNRRIARSQGLE